MFDSDSGTAQIVRGCPGCKKHKKYIKEVAKYMVKQYGVKGAKDRATKYFNSFMEELGQATDFWDDVWMEIHLQNRENKP